MRYRHRTLMIVLELGPAIMVGAWVGYRRISRRSIELEPLILEPIQPYRHVDSIKRRDVIQKAEEKAAQTNN
jgi:hypothetical protein